MNHLLLCFMWYALSFIASTHANTDTAVFVSVWTRILDEVPAADTPTAPATPAPGPTEAPGPPPATPVPTAAPAATPPNTDTPVATPPPANTLLPTPPPNHSPAPSSSPSPSPTPSKRSSTAPPTPTTLLRTPSKTTTVPSKTPVGGPNSASSKGSSETVKPSKDNDQDTKDADADRRNLKIVIAVVGSSVVLTVVFLGVALRKRQAQQQISRRSFFEKQDARSHRSFSVSDAAEGASIELANAVTDYSSDRSARSSPKGHYSNQINTIREDSIECLYEQMSGMPTSPPKSPNQPKHHHKSDRISIYSSGRPSEQPVRALWPVNGNSLFQRDSRFSDSSCLTVPEDEPDARGHEVGSAIRESGLSDRNVSGIIRESEFSARGGSSMRDSDLSDFGMKSVIRETDFSYRGASSVIRDSDFSDRGVSSVIRESDFSDRGVSSVIRESNFSDRSGSGVSRESIMIGHPSFMESLTDNDRDAVQEILSLHNPSLCGVDIDIDDDKRFTLDSRAESIVFL